MWFWILCLNCLLVLTVANPLEGKPGKKFQNAILQQNLQTIIISIEERLRNLDSIYTAHYSPSVEGRLEQLMRKLESVEVKMSRIETIMNIELDKVSENISTQFFKDDITRDHVLRKLDAIYERVNNRLSYAEFKLDVSATNVQNILDTMNRKIDKVEERFTSRLVDIEDDITNAIITFEETKSICLPTNKSKIIEVPPNLDEVNKRLTTVHRDIIDNVKIMEDNLKKSINNSYDVIVDIESNFNEYTTKISEMTDALLDINENTENSLKMFSKLLNLTRNEQQNNFRTLMVQVGKGEKTNNMFRDSSETLDELNRKIDENFENVLLTQNLFLESCHRVQMDESQLENKIGDVLEKLLDTFERKTMDENNDIKRLEHIVKMHDNTMKRTVGQISTNIGSIFESNKNYKDEFKVQLGTIKEVVDELYHEVQILQHRNTQNNTNEFLTISNKLQNVQHDIETINHNLYNNKEIIIAKICDQLEIVLHEIQIHSGINKTENHDFAEIKEILQAVPAKLHQLEIEIKNAIVQSGLSVSTNVKNMIMLMLDNVLTEIKSVKNESTNEESTTEKSMISINEDNDAMEETSTEKIDTIIQCILYGINCTDNLSAEVKDTSGNIIFNSNEENTAENCTDIDVRNMDGQNKNNCSSTTTENDITAITNDNNNNIVNGSEQLSDECIGVLIDVRNLDSEAIRNCTKNKIIFEDGKDEVIPNEFDIHRRIDQDENSSSENDIRELTTDESSITLSEGIVFDDD